MNITSEDIRAIQRKLDSLRKMRHLAERKVKSKTSKKQSSKLEDDVFDSEKFFDEDQPRQPQLFEHEEPSRFTKSLVGDMIVFVNRSLQS